MYKSVSPHPHITHTSSPHMADIIVSHALLEHLRKGEQVKDEGKDEDKDKGKATATPTPTPTPTPPTKPTKPTKPTTTKEGYQNLPVNDNNSKQSGRPDLWKPDKNHLLPGILNKIL